MHVTSLEMFIDAAKAIFVEIGFLDLKINTAGNNNKYDIIASIGITGEFTGFLIIRSNLQSSMNFINKMLSNIGIEAKETNFGQFHKEAFGEILNQISGRATMLLESNGINSNITPPTILTGSNISINTYDAVETLHKNIEGTFGSFNLLVGIK